MFIINLFNIYSFIIVDTHIKDGEKISPKQDDDDDDYTVNITLKCEQVTFYTAYYTKLFVHIFFSFYIILF